MESYIYTKVELQFTCTECGQPVFAYGPFSDLICAYCDSAVKVQSNQIWREFIEYPLENKLKYLGAEDIFYGGMKKPYCTSCKKKLRVEDIADDTDGTVICHECGTENTTYPPPDWMKTKKAKIKGKSMKPVQIFCGNRDNSQLSGQESSSPVLFACLHCGSPLNLSPETPRILSCEYCESDQYMPDTLWRKFHPVPKKRAWFIRWSV